ncbi:MAG: 16S rRNA (adenine(1518)-N(6)/adenine(1519)-N(6))-dimethyltransferase RsmA [Erysipelotrichales bacterium]|nr:16S rRNA (adenine(1518)-N(6)/adenine(1519)-N(6))-dimethyltransferase RsmA [Erysipelotrichales bacterium]
MLEIATLKKTDSLLKLNNLSPKKSLGQNFLINPLIAEDIIKKSDLNTRNVVIEIGPGLGALSEKIAVLAKKLICYEIDSDLVPILKEELSIFPNVEIFNIDFLKVDFKKIINDIDSNEIVIISNLPYYITSEILYKIFQDDNKKIKKVITMMQKEVGNKIVKNEKGKNQSELAILANVFADTKIIKYVSKNDFLPRPKIDSIVVEFLFNNKNDIDKGLFIKVVKTIFAQRRKTIYNNLNQRVNNKEISEKILNECNIELSQRAEDLDIIKFIELAQKISTYKEVDLL